MLRFFELLLAFLRGLFGLGGKRVRGPARKRNTRPTRAPAREQVAAPAPPAPTPPEPPRPAARTAPAPAPRPPPSTRSSRGRPSPDRLATELTEALPLIPHAGGEWDPRERVGVEDGRVAVDLHGLSDEDAVALVEEVLDVLAGREVPLRLITGHGRDRPAGYSIIRMALVDALAERDDIRIDQLGRHRRHADSDDRLGHMDLLVA